MRLDFFYGQFRSSNKTRFSTGPVSGGRSLRRILKSAPTGLSF